MMKWEIGVIIGGVWGLIGIIGLTEWAWHLNPLIAYSFGLPAFLAFQISNIWQSYILFFLLAPIIGALIGAGAGYLIDKYCPAKPVLNITNHSCLVNFIHLKKHYLNSIRKIFHPEKKENNRKDVKDLMES